MKPRKSFLLRLDPELYAQLEGWAEQELRSVNGQIEWLLKQAIERRRNRELSLAESDPEPAAKENPTAEAPDSDSSSES